MICGRKAKLETEKDSNTQFGESIPMDRAYLDHCHHGTRYRPEGESETLFQNQELNVLQNPL
jgi:hypothetical protein